MHMNIEFNRLEIYTNNKIRFKYKIMPISLILTGVYAYGNKNNLYYRIIENSIEIISLFSNRKNPNKKKI